MSLLAVVNPSRRRRRHKKSARRASKRVRRMTAKQLRYFGPKAHRVVRRRRRRTITVSARPNPVRRSRRSARRSARRSFRRNPIGATQMRATLGTVQRGLVNAATGAGGAILTDMAMAQVARFLPATLTSRFTAETGGVNFGYYGVKAGIALALGIAGSRLLPGRMKSLAARGAEGALTVQAYELARSLMPAGVVLGYMSPGRQAGMGKYLSRNRSGMSAYLPSGMAGGNFAMNETRVGEGPVL